MKRNASIRTWILGKLLQFVIPLFLCVLFLQVYMVRKLTGYTLELTGNSVTSYVEELKGSFNQMEQYAASFLRNNEELTTIQMTDDENRLVLAESQISHKIINDIGIYSMIDLALVAVCRDNKWYFMSGGSEYRTMQTELEMREKLISEGTTINSSSWMMLELAEKPFLGRIIRNGNAYCVVLRRADILTDRIRNLFDFDVIPYLTDKDGTLYSNHLKEERDIWKVYGSKKSHGKEFRFMHIQYVISEPIPLLDNLSFRIFLPSHFVLEEVKWIKNILIVFWLILLLMLGEYWIALKKKLVIPSQNLCQAMAHIEETGEIVTERFMLTEIRTMVVGFNEMKKQIYELKIQAYEQKIREQKIYMQYLASQIRPHFFLNSLNILYSLAQIQRYDLIQKMTLALVSYFRYVFKNASDQVALKDEIKHVQDYLEIQKMRFLENFNYHIMVEDNLEHVRILPFLLQTFVENSVKYGMDDNGKMEIFIEAALLKENPHIIRIVVRDCGNGFSDEELERINNGDESFGEQHIGIQNAKQRLMLLYQNEASVRLYNDVKGGAAAEICYPIINRGEFS